MRYTNLARQSVPQTQPLTPDQVPNNAGGFVYELSDWDMLDRILILGTDTNTYYQKAQSLTAKARETIDRCWATNPLETAERVTQMSEMGRAPRNDHAIMVLAIGAIHSREDARRAALGALSRVCRTGTHLFQFVALARTLGRGWGRAMRRAVGNWYTSKTPDALAYHMIKYRQRSGYTHSRLLRCAHPVANGKEDRTIDDDTRRAALFCWALGRTEYNKMALPDVATAFETAMSPESSNLVRSGLAALHKLPWEAFPTEALRDPLLWKGLLPHMGLTAMIRNLGRMTANGAIEPLSAQERLATSRLRDAEALRRARIHPFSVLLALRTYASGEGHKGSLSWQPNQAIVAALNDAFNASFGFVLPSNARMLLALDVSGSMMTPLADSCVTVREASAAMAMVSMRTEPQTHVIGFQRSITPLDISATDSLRDVCQKIDNLPFGTTDCGAPMIYAMQHKIPVDTFVVYTDNETYAGKVHPSEALRQYRKAMGIPARLVVVGMTATNFTIADPKDPGMLDVVGFDSSAPEFIAQFSRDGVRKGTEH